MQMFSYCLVCWYVGILDMLVQLVVEDISIQDSLGHNYLLPAYILYSLKFLYYVFFPLRYVFVSFASYLPVVQMVWTRLFISISIIYLKLKLDLGKFSKKKKSKFKGVSSQG